jgi:hypothetical protein
MLPRDRIRELRRVKASTLRPNPRNWRTHPRPQQDALRGILAEVGYADALLARELQDGSLELIDGHLRAETTPDMEVPVLIVDLTPAEAAKLLAVLDPLAELAEADSERLRDLTTDIETDSIALQGLIDKLARQSRADEQAIDLSSKETSLDLPPAWQLVVECRDEAQQEELYERLSGEGLKCRVLTL